MKPDLGREKVPGLGMPVCLHPSDSHDYVMLCVQYQYKFEHVFDEYASQKAVFEHIALPLVEDLIFGRNGRLSYCLPSLSLIYEWNDRPFSFI